MEATAPVDTLQTTTMWLLWAMIAGAAAVLALYAILERRHTTGSFLRAAIAPVAGVALGTAYGLAMRSTVFDDESRLVMSLAFLGAVPFGMGALTGALLRPGANIIGAVLLPWATVALSIAAALATGNEGVICSVMALPLLLGAASLGGVLVWAVRRRGGSAPLAVLVCGGAVAPIGLVRWEDGTQAPREERTVAGSIDIDAPAATVWREIARVRPIAREELPVRASHLMGFPRPIEATLSFEGQGAVRKASFERGLVFTETVTIWKPLEELSFTIAVDPVPPEALDEHVTIGGPHFDVLDGTYRLEQLAAGGVRLHLSSRHRLSTRFNAYAGWWSDLVMSDIQGAILEVVKARAEVR